MYDMFVTFFLKNRSTTTGFLGMRNYIHTENVLEYLMFNTVLGESYSSKRGLCLHVNVVGSNRGDSSIEMLHLKVRVDGS